MSLLTLWLMYAAALVTPGPNQLLVVQLAASQRRVRLGGPAWAWRRRPGCGLPRPCSVWAD